MAEPDMRIRHTTWAFTICGLSTIRDSVSVPIVGSQRTGRALRVWDLGAAVTGSPHSHIVHFSFMRTSRINELEAQCERVQTRALDYLNWVCVNVRGPNT